jgi:hypothetical protein
MPYISRRRLSLAEEEKGDNLASSGDGVDLEGFG